MKKLIRSLFLAAAPLLATAAPVTSDEAAQAVGTWIGLKPQLGCRMGEAVAGARTCSPTNGVTFHVVKMAGGGFVVTSSDTELEPILAFSASDDLVESEKNPLWTMLRRDLAARGARRRQAQFAAAGSSAAVAQSAAEAKWARLLPVKSTNALVRVTHAATGKETLSDVRVAPLLQTKWSQQQDAYYSNMGDPCYNYYTPDHDPCGCVATAGAQIMRYHRYPTASVTPGTYACRVMTGKDYISQYSYYPVYEDRDLTMQGGVYDWDAMPLVPADGTTLAQRKAIGKLTSDVGISCLMAYGEDGSSAGGYMLARSLPERFGYASAIAACGNGLASSLVRKALISNLDAKLPVMLGLDGSSGGHAVVADGYGYSMSTFYAHVNLGWAGKDDAWYAPPYVDDYNAVDSMVYNIYPTGVAGGVICSGRVLSPSGTPVAGATVSASGAASAATTTDVNGIYAFILPPGSYTVSSGSASQNVTLAANVGSDVTDGGSYYTTPKPTVNNVCDLDLTIVDPTEISVETGGDVPWFEQSAVTCDGTSAWQVGDLASGDDVTSWISLKVQGPCTLSFQFGFQGDSSSFSCWLDDEYVNLDHNWGSGSPSWKLNEVTVAGAGEHDLLIECYGWSGNECARTKYWIGDVTRTAAPAGVTVSFDANGGTCTTSSRYYETGATYGNLPTPYRAQGVFMGWYTAAVGGKRVSEDDFVLFDATQLFAHWGVSLEKALGVDANVSISVDNDWRTEEPYWYGNVDRSYDGNGCACTGFDDGSNGSLYATVNGPGTLTFVARCVNGGLNVCIEKQEEEYSWRNYDLACLGSSASYDFSETYAQDGYRVTKSNAGDWVRFVVEAYGTGEHRFRFYGWEDSSEGWLSCAFVDDMSWTPATGSAIVRFEYADGKFLQDKTYRTGATYGTLPTPTRTGYVFAGWCTDEDLLNAVDADDYVPFDGAHFYAKWKKTLAYKSVNWYESEMTYTTGEKVYRTDVVPEGGDEWGYGSSYYSYVDFEMTGAGFFSFGLNLAGSAQYTISVDGKQVDSKVVFGYMYGESALTLSNWQRQNLTISGSGKHTVRLTVTGTGYTSDTGVALVKDEAFEQYGKAETFGGWSDKVKNYGCWMTGNLPALQAKYAKDTTPKGRVLHALATLLTAAEDKSVQTLFNGFGCAINYMDLNGSWGNVDFAKAPTGNKVVDTLATVGEPLVKTALADLEAISGNMVEFDLSVDDCAFFDEGVTIDYGDILYLRAALKAILGFASWSKAYNVEIDYDQLAEDASGVALKTVSNEKSLMTESAWEKIDWLAPCDADRDGRFPFKAVKAGTSVYVYAPHDDGLKIALLTLVCENRAAEKSFDGTYYSYEGMEEYSNMSLVSEFGDATVLRLDVSKLSGVKIANVKLKRIYSSFMTADEYPAGNAYWGASNTDAERFILHQTKVADKIRNAAALTTAKGYVKEALQLAQQADAKVMARTCECLHLIEYYGNDDDAAQRAQSIAALRRNLPKAIQSLNDGSVQEYEWVDVLAQGDKYANTLADPLAVDVNKLFSGEITRGVLPASVSDDYYVPAVNEMDPTVNGLLPETTRSEWCAFLDAKGVEHSGLSRLAFDYYENGDGTITLTGLVGAEPTGELDIPAEYAGYEVAGIAEEAFHDCAGLTSVSLPATVTFVGEKAFCDCPKLAKITVAAGNDLVQVIDNVLYDFGQGMAVVGTTELTSLTLPDGIHAIGKQAFCTCTNLTTADLSASELEIVGKNAFAGCSGLTSVAFPASLQEVGKEPFLSCSQLKSVSFMGGEPSVGVGFYYLNEKSSAKLVPATTYVQPDQGWSDVPGTWQGRPITYADPVGAREVKFDANGGKCATASLKYVEGEDYYALPTPTRSGYVFDGWWTAKDGGEPVYEGDYVDFSIYPTSTPTLYARWMKAYTLTIAPSPKWVCGFTVNGEDYEGSVSIMEGDSVSVWATADADDPQGDNFVFIKWTVSKGVELGGDFDAEANETSFIMPGADVMLTPNYRERYKKIPATVSGGWTTDPSSGDYVTSARLIVGETASLVFDYSAIYDKVGQEIGAFQRWVVEPADADMGEDFDPFSPETEFVVPDADKVTVKAQYVSPVAAYLAYGFEIQGYAEDEAWFYWSPDGGKTLIPSGQAYPLAAGAVTVTFYAKDAAGIDSTSWKVPPVQKMTVPARASHTEKVENPETGKMMTVTVYDEEPFSLETTEWFVSPEGSREVTFDANGGKCSVASRWFVDGEYDGTYYLLPCVEDRKGYVFDGWYTAKTGGEYVQDGDTVDFSILDATKPTLYAHWLKAYTLTLKGTDVTAEYEGTTYAKTASVLNGGYVRLSAPESYEAKNVTYLFQGWTSSKSYDFGLEFSAASCETAMTMPAADVTMTASYVKESEAAWLTMYATAEAVEADGFTIEPDLQQFYWSVDGKSWFRNGVTALVKKGTCTVQWKSAIAAWAAPTAKTKVTLKAGDEYSNEGSPAEFTFVLAARLTAVVYADGETSESTVGGTATMNPANGQIPKGKVLTLTAKAASDYVFVGWQYEKDAAEEGLCPFSAAATYKLESFGCCGAEYRYVDPDDGAIHLQAVFRPISDYTEDDVRCLFRSVSVGGSSREVSYEENEFSGEVEVKVGLGCACDIALDCSPTGLPIAYALTGTLPKGLKFDAATGRISGTPTAAGTFPLAVKAADPKGHVCSLEVSLVVKSVYAPVVGNWRALLSDESGVSAGLFEMSVAETGKASVKITTATGTTSVTPTITWEPDEEDPDGDGTIYVGYSKTTGNEKTGSEVWLEFDAQNGYVSYGSFAWKNGEATSSIDLGGTALRSDPAMLTDPEFQEAFLGKYYTVALAAEEGDGAEGYRVPSELMASGYLTVTTDKKGAVKVAGKLADGEKVSASTVLLPSEDGASASAILFVVPSGYKKKGSVALQLEFDSQGGVTSSVGAWVTPPLLDAIAGWESGDEIFLPGLLSLSAYGSVYSRLDDLTGYYLSLSVSTGEESPMLEYSYTDAEKTKCYEQAELAVEGYELGSELLTGGKGGKIAVAKSPSPWKDADGYWNYDETKEDKYGNTQPITNPGGVTISFKPATGIFSGKFNLFFDYEVPQYKKGEEVDPKQEHKSVSCSYEGVLVGDSGVAAAQYSGKFTYEYWTLDKNGNEKPATKTYTKKYALPVSWSVE